MRDIVKRMESGKMSFCRGSGMSMGSHSDWNPLDLDKVEKQEHRRGGSKNVQGSSWQQENLRLGLEEVEEQQQLVVVGVRRAGERLDLHPVLLLEREGRGVPIQQQNLQGVRPLHTLKAAGEASRRTTRNTAISHLVELRHVLIGTQTCNALRAACCALHALSIFRPSLDKSFTK